MSWIQTANNYKLDFLNPDPSQICIDDIAAGLSNVPRWAGQLKQFYSVAEHSCLMETLYSGMTENPDPEVSMALLLHDATEAYMCDIPRPLKELLPDYRIIESRLNIMIHLRFGIPMTPGIIETVKELDNRSLVTEAKIRGLELNGLSNIPMFDIFPLRYLSPEQAKKQFMYQWKKACM